MKFIGFFGKSKNTGDPVLEYHPPYEEQPEEEEEILLSQHRQPMGWNGTEDPDEISEDEEDLEEDMESEISVSPAKNRKGKRRMVTAALVMALGAAVYLNWQFSGNQELLASDTLSSEKEMGTAQLVNGEAEETDASASEEEGESVFTQAKLSRQKARDEAVEMLEEVLKDSESSEEAKKEAVAQSAVIAQNVLKENNIENLVKAKGYSDCVAVIQNDECSVIVGGKLENASDAVVIQDIVVSQTSFAPEKIKIIESK